MKLAGGILVVFFFSICCWERPVEAQITGTLYGTVTDPSGAVLPGATVTATSPNLHRTDVFAVTNENGRYRLTALPAGVYRLTVELSGFASKQLSDIRLGIDEDLEVNIVLALEGVEEAVTVIGESPVVDVKDSGLSGSIKPEVIDNMPLNGRQFLDLVLLVPGTAPRPASSGQGSGATVFGERSVTNSFLVDGMENNDDFTRDFSEFYIQDTIQEFKVELGGYAPEFGRASGAVANVITRSGTNDLQARLFLFGRDDALDSSNVEGQDPPDLRRTEVGGFLGGPIKKDKTWFFGAGQRFKETRGNNFDLAQVPAIIESGWFSPTSGAEDFNVNPTARRITAFGKINHQFTSTSQLLGTININLGQQNDEIPAQDRRQLPGPPGTIALPSIASDVENNSYSATTRHTKFFGNAGFLESSFRYLRTRFQENTEKEAGAETVAAATFNALGQAQFWLLNAPNAAGADRLQERYQIKETYSSFRDTSSGSHELKLGVDYNRVNLNRNFVPVQTAIVANTMFENVFNQIQDVSTVEFQRGVTTFQDNRTRTKAHNNIIALFGQDAWEVAPGLTINAGARYDYASLFGDDKNNLAPRVGIAWDPKKDGATVIRASFGIYYDQNILELAAAVPELGGIQEAGWSFQSIPRGGSTFQNPLIGAFGPLQAGGTRWLANPKFFSYILPEGVTKSSGGITITGKGQPYVVYDLLGIPVTDPKNPPILAYDSIGELTGGRLTPEEAVRILNDFFPGASCDQFVWDEGAPEGSIVGNDRFLDFLFRQCAPGIDRINTLERPEKTPFTRSFNAGVERRLFADFSVDAQVFVRRSRDLLAGRVVNLLPEPVGPGCLQNTTTGICNNQTQYIGFLDANVFTLALKKRLSHRYSFLGSYTYTDAVDNFSTLRVPPLGGETSFLYSNHPELDIGRSLNTPNHVFVFSGLWQAPYGVDVSGILRASSGAPFNAAGLGQDSDGDQIFDNRLLGTEKGGYETDPFFNIDVRLAKVFQLGGGGRLTGLVELFNLTNRANPLRVNNALGPAIGTTVEPLPGRELQIGIRYDF